MTILVTENYKLYEKSRKIADFEKLTFYLDILKPYQLYQNINFSDSKCNIDKQQWFICVTVVGDWDMELMSQTIDEVNEITINLCSD